MHLFRSIDVETTSTDDDASVIEIGWTDVIKVDDTGTIKIMPHQSMLVIPRSPISHAARGVHHITDSELEQSGVSFEIAHKEAINCDAIAMVAHNADFEKNFISWPGDWVDTLKVALRMWPDAEDHKNQTLRYHLNIDSMFANRSLAFPPHRAGPDSYTTAFIAALAAQKHKVDLLVEWSNLPKLFKKCPFGKHRGIEWHQIPEDYLLWIIGSSNDLDEDSKWNALHELQKRFVRKLGIEVINCESISDLENLWRNEVYRLRNLKINQGDANHKNIMKMFSDKKSELSGNNNAV